METDQYRSNNLYDEPSEELQPDSDDEVSEQVQDVIPEVILNALNPQPNVALVENHGMSFIDACRTGNCEIAQRIINANNELYTIRVVFPNDFKIVCTDLFKQALRSAYLHNQLEIVKVLWAGCSVTVDQLKAHRPSLYPYIIMERIDDFVRYKVGMGIVQMRELRKKLERKDIDTFFDTEVYNYYLKDLLRNVSCYRIAPLNNDELKALDEVLDYTFRYDYPTKFRDLFEKSKVHKVGLASTSVYEDYLRKLLAEKNDIATFEWLFDLLRVSQMRIKDMDKFLSSWNIVNATMTFDTFAYICKYMDHDSRYNLYVKTLEPIKTDNGEVLRDDLRKHLELFI